MDANASIPPSSSVPESSSCSIHQSSEGVAGHITSAAHPHVRLSSTDQGPTPWEEAGISEEQWEVVLSDAEAHARHIILSAATTISGPPDQPTWSDELEDKQKHIPRPLNTWLIFRQCINKSENLPKALRKCQSQLSSVLGPCWSTLPPARKQVFLDAHQAEAEVHRRRYPNYKYQPSQQRERNRGKRGDIVDEEQVEKPKKEPYEQSTAAAGASYSRTKGKAKAITNERGVAAEEMRYAGASDVPPPLPPQVLDRALAAMPPTRTYYQHPASGSWMIGPSPMSSSRQPECSPAIPTPHHWQSPAPVSHPMPSAPLPTYTPLKQVPAERYSPYVDWDRVNAMYTSGF